MGAFTPVEVARALVSLPVEARLAGGFHRSFVAARAPELSPAEVQLPRRPAGALRGLHRLNLARRRLVRGQRPPDSVDPFEQHRWRDREDLRAWVCEEILEHPLLTETMGREWTERTRVGFLEGRARASALALLACGPVTLERALADDRVR
jgi:hypothetical protein